MILLSALLASLSGLVSGEREPVRAHAQVQASAVVSVVEAAAVAGVSLIAAWVAFGIVAVPRRRLFAAAYAVRRPRLARRLALKQSWLN